MRVCANLSFMFPEHQDLLDRYRAAAAAGFEAVECAFPYHIAKEVLAAAKEECGLEQVLLNAEPGDCLGHGGRKGEEEKFMSSLTKSLEYCLALGTKKLHIMAGKKIEGVGQEEATQIFMENLRRAIPLLEEAGVVGLIEPINPWSVPGYNMDTFQAGLHIVRTLDHPNIRLQLDMFHLQQVEGNLTRNMEKYLPYVGHVQIAQVPARGEPNSAGEIDYKYVFRCLEKFQYDGWVGLEYKPVGATVEGLGWIKEMGLTM